MPPLELFRGAALSLVGSIASKCVDSHELGKNLVTIKPHNIIKCIVEN